MDNNIPLVTIGFDGYGLEQTLQGMAKTKSKNMILCCIDGFTKHVIPEQNRTRGLGPDPRAGGPLPAHLLRPVRTLQPFRRRGLEEAQDENGVYPFHGRPLHRHQLRAQGYREKQFYQNLPEVVELAEQLDLTVCLETHGDMLQSGKDCERLFKKIKSKRIRVSYDPANIYFYNRGSIKPAEDIKHALEHVGMIHFKGVNHSADKSSWGFPLLKESAKNDVFDYDGSRSPRKNRYQGMVAVELEGRFRHEEGKGFIIDPLWPEAEVVDKYDQEIDYLTRKITWY